MGENGQKQTHRDQSITFKSDAFKDLSKKKRVLNHVRNTVDQFDYKFASKTTREHQFRPSNPIMARML